jgi:hypothetical protein
VVLEKGGKITNEQIIKSKKIFLKMEIDIKGVNNQFFFSLDNKQFQQSGEPFTISSGYWKRSRMGLFSFNETHDSGTALFEWFTYNYNGLKYNE